MNDDQLLRYSRHILLDEVGIEGQQAILDAHVLIIGAGGLGSPAALYLAASGVGQITIVDHDQVDMTNLQRQIAHTTDRVGQPKVQSAAQAMHAINPDVQVRCIQERATPELLDQLVAQATVNAACVRHRVPLVAGAIIRFDGQITVFDPRQTTSPCYACLFSPDESFEEVQCSTMGVFAPLVGIIGCMQAAESLKIIANIGNSLAGKLLMLDGKSMEWSVMKTSRNSDCLVCNPHSMHLHK